MKKFEFSLQRLLKYKEQLFDAEQTILRDMRALLHKMEAELDNMRLDRKRRADEYRQKVEDGTTIYEMELNQTYMRILDDSMEQKRKQIQLQQLAIDKQMDKVREAKIEISTLEKLREKKLEEYNYIAAKQNELFIEEYIIAQKSMGAGNIR